MNRTDTLPRDTEHRSSNTIAIAADLLHRSTNYDDDAIRQHEHFIEIRGVDNDRDTAVTSVTKSSMDVDGRTYVESTRRLVGHEQLRMGRELTRKHDPLLVSSRQRSNSNVRSRCGHAVTLEQFLCRRTSRMPRHPPLPPAGVVQGHILR